MTLSNTLDHWMDMLHASAQDCAQTMLACSNWSVRPMGSLLPEGMAGAYVPLVGEELKLQIGIVADSEGCTALAKDFLGTPEVSEADMVDALNEIANMIAGGVKNRAFDRQIGLKIGLPLFLEGYIHITNSVVIETSEIRVGNTAAFLMLIHSSNESSLAD